MRLVGLTGGIASGKSTTSEIFRSLGAQIIDADLVAREVVQPGRWAWKRIVSHFGREILQEDQGLDRKRLGAIVFENPAERRFLNSVTHPPIIATVLKEIAAACFRRPPLVVLDAALLIESPLKWIARRTVVVYVDSETQLQRLIQRDGLTEREARLRMDSQMPLDEKRRQADYVIDNSGTLEETRTQVEHLWNRLTLS